MEDFLSALGLLAFLALFGRALTYFGDIVRFKLPHWARRILFVVDIRGSSVGICVIIFHMMIYMMIILNFGHFIQWSATAYQKFNDFYFELIKVLYSAGFVILIYSWICDWVYKRELVERAILHHFDNDIWISSSRKIVDEKLEYAKSKMTALISDGKVKVNVAVKVFNKSAFTKHHNITGKATIQYDPLTGREILYLKEQYYFFALEGSGYISEIEDYIRENWKDDVKGEKRLYGF